MNTNTVNTNTNGILTLDLNALIAQAVANAVAQVVANAVPPAPPAPPASTTAPAAPPTSTATDTLPLSKKVAQAKAWLRAQALHKPASAGNYKFAGLSDFAIVEKAEMLGWKPTAPDTPAPPAAPDTPTTETPPAPPTDTPDTPTEPAPKVVSARKAAQWEFTKGHSHWLRAIWMTSEAATILDYLEKIPLSEKAFGKLVEEYPNHDLQTILPVLPASILIDLAKRVVVEDTRFCGQRWGSNPKGAFSQAAAAEARALGKTTFVNAYGFDVPADKLTVRQKIAAAMAAKGAIK